MQIDNSGVQSKLAAEVLEPNKPAAAKPNDRDSSATSVSGSVDKLSLTSEAAMMQSIESDIAELPEVDTARVQAIQAAVASGSYQVDSAKAAEKMLNFESGLG
jgi:negative regulator of flagellin synthesis FlgM